MRVMRLTVDDRDLARVLFTLMADVFGEARDALSDGYLDQLLSQEAFWALAALAEDHLIGGLTAHTLPMTRTESSELFIYDIAVRPEHQRQGVGRRLVAELRAQAAARGIREVFVAADNDDVQALDFYRALGGAGSPVTIFTFTQEGAGGGAS
jgi:aminoglycoside 3-N-acetyltransferase I